MEHINKCEQMGCIYLLVGDLDHLILDYFEIQSYLKNTKATNGRWDRISP
jgi:hypothetical protein